MMLLIVEDTESTAVGSANLFRQDQFEVHHCRSYTFGLALFNQLQPDAALIDAMIPLHEHEIAQHDTEDRERGFALADKLKTYRPKFGIVMTSAHVDLERPYRQLLDKWKTGVGFVNKSDPHQTYRDAVQAVLRGENPMYEALQARISREEQFLSELHPTARQVVMDAYQRLIQGNDKLTPKEMMTSQAIRLGLTAEGIAAEIASKPDTVRKHLQNSYEKLGITRQELRHTKLEPGKVLDWVMTLYEIRNKPKSR